MAVIWKRWFTLSLARDCPNKARRGATPMQLHWHLCSEPSLQHCVSINRIVGALRWTVLQEQFQTPSQYVTAVVIICVHWRCADILIALRAHACWYAGWREYCCCGLTRAAA